MRGYCRFCIADRLCEGGAELEIVECFLDDDEGLEADHIGYTAAYRMCSGGQQWWKGVGGDDGT